MVVSNGVKVEVFVGMGRTSAEAMIQVLADASRRRTEVRVQELYYSPGGREWSVWSRSKGQSGSFLYLFAAACFRHRSTMKGE